ncbi:Pharynx and intestine in excess protein 1 [Ancistrocladus abbreviatus]
MASKGPRSKLDHETRARRQKALEAPREPHRPKTHWDHVLAEMIWLSKDFESERKWKIAQAKKVALRASKGKLDQAMRGEKRMKEEEQRMRKIALSISKDVKKFWTKIEKLVLYKHQLELDDKKKKALDKQLEYLLGQTERYSTMLAENLLGTSNSSEPLQQRIPEESSSPKLIDSNEIDANGSRDLLADDKSDAADGDDEYDIGSEDDLDDDEQTIEEDEALITKEERQEELAALQHEVDLPLEELLKRYSMSEANGDCSPEMNGVIEVTPEGVDPSTKDGGDFAAACKAECGSSPAITNGCGKNKSESLSLEVEMSKDKNMSEGTTNSESEYTTPESHSLEVETSETKHTSEGTIYSESETADYEFDDEQEDGEFVFAAGEEKDDEVTLEEEEELAKAESNDAVDEIALLQKESEIPIEELLARYKKDSVNCGSTDDESDCDIAHSNPPLDQGHEVDELTTIADEDASGKHPGSPSHGEESVVGHKVDSEEGSERENKIADAAAAARSAQPTGNTFSTTKVRTKFPFLLKHPLREYQHIGLDWLVTMYEKRLNGILADEMGLGKTIMTIALLAHLACEKGIWGPHLIVVPTSVMLNWETEFLKWCPAFKILTYFGSAKERKHKRQGWMKPNSFHVCITTYRLVIQDSKVFKRKKWKYLILDEAHLIKNWKSQRWQTLLNFNSKRRILLTGTPLQNDLMELWSLMHFLMPHIFQSHQEFKDWFSNPISGMVEGQEKVNKEVVDRLHNVLRPFILRRLKRDVETQLPMKHEHVIYCRLSKRQRNLYEDFIASSETQATLASANFFGMLNVIMQLRKVCNHPDLFEGRPIVSSFDMAGIDMLLSSVVCSILSSGPFSALDLSGLGLLFTHLDFTMTSWESDEIQSLAIPSRLIEECANSRSLEVIAPCSKHGKQSCGTNIFGEIRKAILEERLKESRKRAADIAWWNSLKCQKKPIYSTTLRDLVTLKHPLYDIHLHKSNPVSYDYSSRLADIVPSPVERFERMIDQVESFMFAIPAARVPPPVCWCSKSGSSVFLNQPYKEKCSEILLPLLSPIRPAIVRRQLYFPDRRLIQFDCGKLQQLAVLLRRLKSEGHRALIFTQMTKMLDILEAFINLYGYTYMRLDGSTQPEERQTLMQRFNTNPKIFLFILSTRSGGVGINLIGADTVIFYDSDWNPAMDQQAQDRCHRIGQTREVHIYRLISDSTIEENILKKANQKRVLDDLVIQSGGYNTEFFKKLDPMELFSGHRIVPAKNIQKEKSYDDGIEAPVSNADLEAALKYAEDEADYMALKKVEEEEAVDNQEFTEEAIGRLEDDDLANEDDLRADESAEQDALIAASKEIAAPLTVNEPDEEKAVTFTCNEDDVDMIADVKQMAAAAVAAGDAVSSLENQLRPIDRYAMRFLEFWDPIINKDAIEYQMKFEEAEWELERIEKLKEDMEAEIDDEEEPLVYERWDAEFATQAYRQQVEALAQHQLMEELENKAKEEEDAAEDDFIKNERSAGAKPKSKKKKPKKTKFKSLKKGSLASPSNTVKEEAVEPVVLDDEDVSTPRELPRKVLQKKRKKVERVSDSEEGKTPKTKSKKAKKDSHVQFVSSVDSKSSSKQQEESKDLRSGDDGALDLELKPASRGKMGGRISITAMPMKRVLMLRPEKLKKKGNMWSSDYFPLPDSWSPQEDAILCALVHEYASNWSLVSDTLYGMTAGGFYRGRFRHPVHCCERYRELIQKYVLTVADSANNEKASNTATGKALLRVSEDNIRMLLDVAMELPDRELLLQRHFTALLSSVWRVGQQRLSVPESSVSSGGRLFGTFVIPNTQSTAGGPPEKIKFTNLHHCRKLLTRALDGVHSEQWDDTAPTSRHKEVASPPIEKLEVTLELVKRGDDDDDDVVVFPSAITLSIPGSDPSLPANIPSEENRLRPAQIMAEQRFRAASSVFPEDSHVWTPSAFRVSESKPRAAFRSPLVGKHKLSAGEINKTSRSKIRKVAAETSESHALLSESLFSSLPTVSSSNLEALSDLLPSVVLDDLSGVIFDESPSGLDGEFPLEASSVLQHHYKPGFISGLDDFRLLPEYTDIG